MPRSHTSTRHLYGTKGGKRSINEAGEIPLDLTDSNDQAMDLVINHDFKINNAIRYTKAPTTYQGLWNRVQRHNSNQELIQKEEEAACCLASLFSTNAKAGAVEKTLPSVTPQSSTASKAGNKERRSPPSDLGLSTSISSPKVSTNKHMSSVDAAIETMPGWVDRNKVKTHHTIKRRLTGGLVNDRDFHEKVERDMRRARYTTAFKIATEEAYQNKNRRGKKQKKVKVLTRLLNASTSSTSTILVTGPSPAELFVERWPVGITASPHQRWAALAKYCPSSQVSWRYNPP